MIILQVYFSVLFDYGIVWLFEYSVILIDQSILLHCEHQTKQYLWKKYFEKEHNEYDDSTWLRNTIEIYTKRLTVAEVNGLVFHWE
jgi:hypothetical protein